MPEPKTKPTAVDVDAYLNAIDDDARRADAFALLAMMKKITGEKPKMWGPSIIGFGEYHYVYDSGHEGDACLAGFSPRKAAHVIYFNAGLEERFVAELAKLGKFKASKGCLYVKKLSDVDQDVLRSMIQKNVKYLAGTAKPKKSRGR